MPAVQTSAFRPHADQCLISGMTVSDSRVDVRGEGGRSLGPRSKGGLITEYLIYFNQQWVGDHTEEWFVADDDAAKVWAGKVAEACGWPHEVRPFKPRPQTE